MQRKEFAGDFLVISAFFLVSSLIRVYSKNITPYNDEIGYLTWAKIIIVNHWSYPNYLAEVHPPLFPYTIAVIIRLFGADLTILRLISVIWGSLTVCVVYLLGKELFDRRVGALSAIFLCFCSYYIIFSQIIMMEAMSIFFICSFLYLFWKGYFEHENAKYLYLAGITLGLGMLVKFTMVLPALAVTLFLLWHRRSLKAFIDRRLWIVFGIAFLIILPYLVDLYIKGVNPFYFHLFSRFDIGEANPWLKSSIIAKAFKGFIEYNRLLVYGKYLIPWGTLLEVGTLLLFPITVLPHVYLTLRGDKNSSYVLIYFVSTLICITFFFAAHLNYLLYLFPVYFILLSALAFRCIDYVKVSKSIHWTDFIRLFILFLVFIMIGSYILMGSLSPFVEKGELDGIRLSTLIIRDRLISEGFNTSSPVLIGLIEFSPSGWYGVGSYLLSYHLDKCDVNAEIIPLVVREGSTDIKRKYIIDMDSIKKYEPKFIVISSDMYSTYMKVVDNVELLENYRFISSSELNTLNPSPGHTFPSMSKKQSGEGVFVYYVYERKI
jgi:hypothetical protein